MMPPGKAAISCWTCRVRKKKCDRVQPVCKTCLSLGITCHFDVDRPAWFDNGQNQDAMMNHIKAEVKSAAEARKKRQYIRVVHLDSSDNRAGHSPLIQQTANVQTPHRGVGRADSSSSMPSSPLQKSLCSQLHAARGGGFGGGTLSSLHGPSILSTPAVPLDGLAAQDMEMGFAMTYIDYVFPFFFPFYRPSIREAGRNWLLAVLKNNKVICHTAMSLSGYLSTLVLSQATFQPNDKCRLDIWARLKGHLDLAIRIMQQDIQEIKAGSTNVSIFRKCQAVNSIVQLLISEVAITRTATWDVHLAAAAALIHDLFEHHGINGNNADMSLIMNGLNRDSWRNYVFDGRIWNTDQGAFRFYTAILLYADIIGSTLLATSPRMLKYHTFLMAPRESINSPQEQLVMENYVGCQGWVLMIVAEIAAMDACKTTSISTGTPLYSEFAAHGESIAQKLQHGIADIHMMPRCPPQADATRWLRSYAQNSSQAQGDEGCSTTLIWAYATEIYLHLVISGWDPMHPKIRHNVKLVLDLLLQVSSPAQIRSLSWPICIAGCLASADQEATFTHVLGTLGPFQSLGSIKDVHSALQQVWNDRGQVDKHSWSFAKSFQKLAPGILLI